MLRWRFTVGYWVETTSFRPSFEWRWIRKGRHEFKYSTKYRKLNAPLRLHDRLFWGSQWIEQRQVPVRYPVHRETVIFLVHWIGERWKWPNINPSTKKLIRSNTRIGRRSVIDRRSKLDFLPKHSLHALLAERDWWFHLQLLRAWKYFQFTSIPVQRYSICSPISKLNGLWPEESWKYRSVENHLSQSKAKEQK